MGINPFNATASAGQQSRLAFIAAQRAIERQGRNDIVQLTAHAKRSRVHCAGELLELREIHSARRWESGGKGALVPKVRWKERTCYEFSGSARDCDGSVQRFLSVAIGPK